MATTPSTRVTTLGRDWRLDINTVADPGTGYAELMGREDAKLIEEFRTTDDEVHEDGGAGSDEVTGYRWRIEVELKYSMNQAGTARDPVQKFVRGKYLGMRGLAARQSEFGMRWYNERGFTDEAHEGRVYVKSWTPKGGKDSDIVTVVLQGQGTLADITNPAASQLPVVTSVVPATGAAAGGEIINIYGNHFTAATDVAFAADAADYTLIHDGHIVAVAPAHAAGTVQVKVTTPEGVSANTAADDYVYTA